LNGGRLTGILHRGAEDGGGLVERVFPTMAGGSAMHAVSITDFGAVGDGRTLNTEAFRKAVGAVREQNGGTVYVPAGTWLSGTIELASNVCLELHPAAVILGSPRLADYKTGRPGQHGDRTPWHLVLADGCHDVTIRGGTIDGNGPAYWEPCRPGPVVDPAHNVPPGAFNGWDAIHVVPVREPDDEKAPISWIKHVENRRPSPMIEITACRNVRLQDVHITNSAGWLLHTHNTRYLWITGVKLTSNLMGPNNDGFDITGCQDVVVSDCNLSCCDDAICLKTTPDALPVERVTITNCTVRSRCAAIKFGCAETYHDFRQVTISNCVIYESNRAVAIYSKCGAIVEDVAISNIVCETRAPFMASRPIHIECKEEHNGQGEVKGIGEIRNVQISNLVARTDGRIVLAGDPRSPLKNIVLRDIRVSYPTVDDPAIACEGLPCGQFVANHRDARTAAAVVVAKHARNLVVDNLMVEWPATDDAGRVDTPPGWRFAWKAANGGYDHYPRERFNTDTVPAFGVLWGRDLRGGYLRAPLARPPRDEIPRSDLDAGSTIAIDG
jgi:hypothetical protein